MENRNKLIGGGVIPPPVFPEFIKNIDWKLLREQKYLCLQFIEAGYEMGRKVPDAVQGLIHLVDAIQDYATDVMGLTDKEVFDLTPEDE